MKRKFLTYSTIVLLCISLSLLVSCKDAKLINEKTAASHKTKK